MREGQEHRKTSMYKGKFRTTRFVAAVSGDKAIVTRYIFRVPSISVTNSKTKVNNSNFHVTLIEGIWESALF